MTSAVIPEPKTPSRGCWSASTGENQTIRMREVLIASGGQRFHWRTPYLADNSIVLLEDLFHAKEGDPSTRMYGHLGTHVQTMKKFAQQLFTSRA